MPKNINSIIKYNRRIKSIRNNRNLNNSINNRGQILSRFDKNISIVRNTEFNKKELLRNLDKHIEDKLRKRQKFSPYDEYQESMVDESQDISICSLFDTGFEDDCDYLQYVSNVGPYTYLENYESFQIGDTEEDIFDLFWN